jgi:hypothetical protein
MSNSIKQAAEFGLARGGQRLVAIDIGPLLQVQKLLDSIQFARRKGITRELTAAELK